MAENATEITQLPDKCHVKSFAEIVTKDAEYFAEVFSTEACLFRKHSINNAFNLHKDFDDTFAMSFIEASKTHFRTDNNENVSHVDAESESVKQFPTVKKRKKRTDYNKNYKKKQKLDPAYKTSEQILQYNYKQTARQNPVFKANKISYQGQSKPKARQNPLFKAKECAAKANERQHPAFKANEISYQGKSKPKLRQNPAFKANEISYQGKSKQKLRQNPAFKANEISYQGKSKQKLRQDPAFKVNEISYQGKSKQKLRQDLAFKANEISYQGQSKRKARQNPEFKAKESAAKANERQDPAFKANEISYQGQSKQKARQNPVFKAKECAAKANERQDPAFKANEIIYQGQSKRKARQNPVFKANEIKYQYESKQKARQDQLFQSNEARNQRLSKQNARKRPFVLECERLRQQQKRQQNRKLDYTSKLNNQSDKKVEETLQSHRSYKSYQKRTKTIDDCIKEFHSSILVGPLYVCTCCHQTWFRKSVSMLKNTHLPTRMRSYCTEFTSVNDEEWVCHTCLNSLKDNKAPRLSVANGIKWPNKPPELNLHQLEERLIALRIPFMQIRELPRGGQYSLKGNVINVPIDIQPTINCLPRPMDENFTVAIQLKKKLSYKTVDFKENVRPLRVLTALHWLVNNSEFYKNSGIAVNDNWHKEVTESAEETVKEFLEVTTEQTNIQKNNQINKDATLTANDWTETDGYDSDHYSEIDANDQVGNVDTLVDDADIENKYDQVFTFAPGEGQHPLSLYLDKDAEYLCFPSIFCGQRRPDNEDRLVQLHYSDILKWELRSVDRRAAQSVPNIFFKHKKLQMKQISDKVNLAVRRCKNKGKKITVAEARDSRY